LSEESFYNSRFVRDLAAFKHESDLILTNCVYEALRDVARRVPLDRLLVETDSPYLAPVPHRGKPNEPQFVRDVAEFVAELKGVSFAQLAEQTTTNFHRLFPKAQGFFPAV